MHSLNKLSKRIMEVRSEIKQLKQLEQELETRVLELMDEEGILSYSTITPFGPFRMAGGEAVVHKNGSAAKPDESKPSNEAVGG